MLHHYLDVNLFLASTSNALKRFLGPPIDALTLIFDWSVRKLWVYSCEMTDYCSIEILIRALIKI